MVIESQLLAVIDGAKHVSTTGSSFDLNVRMLALQLVQLSLQLGDSVVEIGEAILMRGMAAELLPVLGFLLFNSLHRRSQVITIHGTCSRFDARCGQRRVPNIFI